MGNQFNGDFSWEDLVNQQLPSPYSDEDMERVRKLYDSIMESDLGRRLAQITENESSDISIFLFTMCRDSITSGHMFPMMSGDPNNPQTVQSVKHPEDGTQVYGLSGYSLTNLLINSVAMVMKYMEIDNTLQSIWNTESEEPTNG